MNVKFVVNDYVLIWNLLFQASISESIYKLKQKLWINYKEEYNSTYHDKETILKNAKDFIPNDDTIYNLMLENKEFDKIKRRTEKYRNEVLRNWDNSKKQIDMVVKELLKKTVEDYTILIVDEDLNVLESTKRNQEKNKVIVLGKKINKKDCNQIIMELVYEIFKKELKEYPKINEDISAAIIDLAVQNELATRLYNQSYYFMGNQKYTYVKRQIYPYWLMYLGVEKEEMPNYMLRDKIAFDLTQYPYEKALKGMNLEEFIDFCIRNKRHMIKEEKLELI